MVSKFSTWMRPALAALVLFWALGLASAQAQSGGAGATNSSKPAGAEKTLPGQGPMDRFEDELFGTHKPMDVQPPGVDVPERQRRLRVVQPDATAKEKMDAQKNWVFSGINELNSPPKPEDLLGVPELGPDGLPKPKLSAVDRYYDDMSGGSHLGSNQMSDVITMMWTVKQLSSTNALNPMVLAFPGADASMMKTLMMLPDMEHPGGDASAAADASAPSDSVAAAEVAASADRDQKRHEDAFKEMLGIGPASPAGAPGSFGGMNSFSPAQPAAAPAFNPGYSPASTPFDQSSLSPVAGGFTSSAAAAAYHPYDPSTPAPATSAAQNYDNMRSLLTQPSRTPQPPPLDPFTENFPKRKF
jgi:hypothetical protein